MRRVWASSGAGSGAAEPLQWRGVQTLEIAMPLDTALTHTDERPTGQAMLRGALGRCPSCGEGRLFTRFLKVADHCPACNEALHHQRADDLSLIHI